MKKTRMGMVVLSLLVCMGMSGCSGNGSNTGGIQGTSQDGAHVTGQSGQSGTVREEKESVSSEGSSDGQETLYMIQKEGESASNCSTENGYYYLTEDAEELKDGSYGQHLMYMDYATKQEIYLCSSSGCRHDSASCPSVFVNDNLGNCSLFVYENNLYLFSQIDYSGATFMNADGELEMAQKPACLYRMNLDGTGREKVVTFDENLTVEDGIIGGKNALYFIEKKAEMKQKKNGESYYATADRMLVRVDTETWKISEQCELDSETLIKGCSKNQLVCVETVYDHEPTEEELSSDDTWKELYKNSQTRFALFNLSDGSTREIVSISNTDGNSWNVSGNWLYVSEEKKQEIRAFNLETGEEHKVASLKNNNIFAVLNDVIYCTCWNMTDDYTMYFVHPDTGKVDHCKLVNRSLGWRLEIKAETENYFLVVYDYDATAMEDDSYEIHKYQYGLITKEDLYAGNDQIQPINMIGKGI